MGRLHNLEQTLPFNLMAAATWPNIEFVVLNYNSPDAIDQWMCNRMMPFIRAGRLCYHKTTDPEHFQPSHAKNIVHRLARGTILCNLDADNFASEQFICETLRLFGNNADMLTHGRRSAWGRICIRRDDFIALGGYDQQLDDGWGMEDIDLILRARRLLRLRVRDLSRFDNAIRNTLHERTRFMRITDGTQGRQRNVLIMRQNLRAGKLVANQDHQWGRAALVKNWSACIEV